MLLFYNYNIKNDRYFYYDSDTGFIISSYKNEKCTLAFNYGNLETSAEKELFGLKDILDSDNNLEFECYILKYDNEFCVLQFEVIKDNNRYYISDVLSKEDAKEIVKVLKYFKLKVYYHKYEDSYIGSIKHYLGGYISKQKLLGK